MDKFFNKNKLSSEQQSRWDWAVCKYREIREQNMLNSFNDNKITESILLSEVKTGQEMLNERRSLGLSDIPSNEEINKMVDKKIAEYFKSGYSQDNEGNLFIEVWVLKKIQGEVKKYIYMKF